MAIVHVVDRVKAGYGRCLSALALAEAQFRAGWDTRLLLVEVASPEVLPGGLPWDLLLGPSRAPVYRDPSAVGAVSAGLAARTAPGDTVVCHEGVDLAAACRLTGRRVVAAVHSDPYACLGYLPAQELALAAREAVAWMVWGTASAIRLRSLLPVGPRSVLVTGQATETFEGTATPLPGSPACLTVARIHPVKNHGLMLAACALLAARSDVRWHMVGPTEDRAYHQRLTGLARRLGIEDRVVWHGYRSDARELMLGSSVMVLASHHEGMPRAVQEAMSLGVPTVLPAALARDISHAGLPITFTSGAHSLAAAVVAATRADADQLATAASWIRKGWNWERILRDWARVVSPEELPVAVL